MKHFLLCISLISCLHAFGDQHLKYIQNKGQWSDNILFKAPIQSGTLFLEKNQFTYAFFDAEKLHQLHHLEQESEIFTANEHSIDAYAFQVEFINTSPLAHNTGLSPLSEYHNYFLGNNPSLWKGKVPLFEQVRQSGIYQGIDLLTYSQETLLKYDFIVYPTGNPSDIQLQYKGVNPELKNGKIYLDLGFSTLIEQKPYAYQLINGEEIEVSCNYVLKNNELSFEFPEGYDKNNMLVIDPVLIVATYSGSTQTGYGHSATYDNLGNIYTGEISFGTGYPVSTGAFQIPYGGGGQDIAISKLNPDGSDLIWASYLGGSQVESPQSLVVNNIGELYVFGTTASTDYPTTSTAYQTSMGGGWSDFIVSHLSEDGSEMIGSTFLGGSEGESLIGEIIVDDFGNAYVSSGTNSTDFPTSVNAIQANWGGAASGWGTAGIVFKINAEMSNLAWSTYLSSSESTTAKGIKLGPNGSVYVTGDTNDGFLTTANSFSPNFLGEQDAFICQIDISGSNLIASTYYGGDAFDGGIFLDVDPFGDVYITGTTSSNLPITAGCVGNANSGVFITKLSNNLSQVIWQTTIGDGTGFANFTPNAFMVDVCRKVYVGGFGAGGANLFTTEDAFFDGGDWSEGYYMTALETNATSVFFASYFQGDHVDGGTSRFDPNGIIYQAVCSPNSITPTPNAYSTCLTGSYDVAVFKVDFDPTSVNALAAAGPSTSGCAPFTVSFENNSSADEFIWDFDDNGATSTENTPSYTFNNPGTYNVMLIAIDSNSCNIRDTFNIPINISTPTADFDFSFGNTCEDSTVQFQAIGASELDVFDWNFGDGTSSTQMNPTHVYTTAGTYTVELDVESFCGATDFVSYELQIAPPPPIDLGPDDILCYGESKLLDATTPGCNYLWQDGNATATYNVTFSGTYAVTVSSEHCSSYDETTIIVDDFFLDAGEDTTFCNSSFQTTLNASSGAISYLWSTGQTTQSIQVTNAGQYTLTANSPNNCSYFDTVNVFLNDLPIAQIVSSDTEACAPAHISFADASGVANSEIVNWEWYFEGMSGSEDSHVYTNWNNPGTFDVGLSVSTSQGCSDSILLQDYIKIHPNPKASFVTEPLTLDWCEPNIRLINTTTDYTNVLWDFGDGNSSEELNPYHEYEAAQSYHISLYAENEFDCSHTFGYDIHPTHDIPFYVPNAFSPENDGNNESFKAYSECIRDYELWVFNRWGALIFYSNDINTGWDGTYLNQKCPIGVYSWKIKYHGGKDGQIETGEVTLLR